MLHQVKRQREICPKRACNWPTAGLFYFETWTPALDFVALYRSSVYGCSTYSVYTYPQPQDHTRTGDVYSLLLLRIYISISQLQ